MIGRLRQLVPIPVFWLFCVVFLVFEGPVLYAEWRLGLPMANLKLRPGRVLLYFMSAFYGLHRAFSFHPFYQTDYRKWLELSPWTVRKRLPVAPIDLTWEDGIFLSGLVLVGLTQPVHQSVRILTIFLFFNCLMLTATFWSTGVGTFGYLAAFGLGLVARLWPYPWFCFAAVTVVYLLVYEGLWRSLARFPWSAEPSFNDLGDSTRLSQRLVGPFRGWPHDRLLRDIRAAGRFHLGRLDAVLISLLLGWCTFGLEGLIPDRRDRLMLPTFFLLPETVILFVGRIHFYFAGYADPISIWGRIWTLRWIIPGYDKALLGSLLTLLAAPAVIIPAWASGVPLEIALPMAISMVCMVALVTPPALLTWRLTGQHRMRPGIVKTNPNFVQVG